MKKLLVGAVLALALSGCAITKDVFGPTPEARIATGAHAVTAAAAVATALLKNDKITVAQAKGYSGLLHTAGDHLKTANAALEGCRRATASTSVTIPDPCTPTVDSDIRLALAVVGEVRKVLSTK